MDTKNNCGCSGYIPKINDECSCNIKHYVYLKKITIRRKSIYFDNVYNGRIVFFDNSKLIYKIPIKSRNKYNKDHYRQIIF